MGGFDGIEDSGKVVAGLVGGRSDLSEILDAGQALIAGMRLTTGWGQPEQGEAFGQGAGRFADVADDLRSAHPGEEWQGGAAQAYAHVNRRQAGRAEAVATLDLDVQTVVAREAHQVACRRDTLDDQSDHLADLGDATRSLGLIPGVGKALKAAIELAAVNTALNVCSAELQQLSRETSDNASALRGLVGEYSALTRKTAPPSLGEEPPVPPSEDPPPASEGDEAIIDGLDRESEAEPAPVAAAADPEIGTDVPASVVAAPPPPPMAGEPQPPVWAGAADPAATPAMAADPMSGMTSAFGAVGGMIGAVVAPLAAVLTGVAGAAGQSLTALTSPESADLTADRSEDGPSTNKEDSPTERGGADTNDADTNGAVDDGEAGASADAPGPDVIGEAEAQTARPPDASAPDPPPAPAPAPTRPPR
ncbi:hypothetical protein Mycch_0069 [Mycolicibacterium chubuense NBB4]|uniref:ESX-1 secretion-associated protein EspA/EspE-like domain-containing protein n=1 Tax=Mycolicibacterium chubuense (strain NBB4) TaxID=710421 RepID=I4BC90_MYCCN|nr:EspA/EspE family type VII secretion system effector [Mycolicibacterium chubuense]AFM14897.1 hypothetical protein Mycch_0069 [Mycolicibacterium chubuense NBB4]